MGLWRSTYWLFGLEYPERWDERQRQLKYECVLQIQKSNLRLRKVKPPLKVNKNEVVKNVIGNRKVRIAEQVNYIPPPPPCSPDQSYAILNDFHYNDTITELKTLFKNKRKKSWNKKKKRR